MGKVLVAMSGGVDSSVAALLLKKEGYDVSGITMCLGVKVEKGKPRCCGLDSIEDARRVADRIYIPHYVLDFSQYLEEKIISNFIAEYLRGNTPNPCIDCNKFLKFGILLEKALSMGFDFLATGHYARINRCQDNFFLKRAKDDYKDQSYFLYPIKKDNLKFILFPLGDFTKSEVRRIAKENNLPVADKPQSQDICFIPQSDYREFIIERIGEDGLQEGDIVDKNGNILGKHKGLFKYTIGQREGLNISYKYPLYVIHKDKEKNRIIVGCKDDLQVEALIASQVNILVDELPQECFAKIRYHSPEIRCKIFRIGEKLKVIFEEKVEAPACGQSIVFYDNDTVLGGGVIEEVIWQNN